MLATVTLGRMTMSAFKATMLAVFAALASSPSVAEQWYEVLNISPGHCADVGGSDHAPAAIVDAARLAGYPVKLVDNGDEVDVLVQTRGESIRQFEFFRTEAACRKVWGFVGDTAPKGSDLDKYR